MNEKKGVQVETKTPVLAYQTGKELSIEIFDPAKAVEQGKLAAQALKAVVDNKPKKVIINGEQYLEFEDWQTLGRFYGITAGTVETTEIIRDGKLVGFSAKAEALQGLYRQKRVRISSAEASCLRSERNWIDKPEFQLKSMAQTRASAKVLRNVLAWVVVLAGYRPTPAEEITGQENGNSLATQTTGNGKCEFCSATGKFHKKGCPNA